MKKIATVDAVGHVLCHDVTQIIRGVTKDAAFRKGHIVREEDIPVLLSMGKDNLYIWENDETKYHENEAAERLVTILQNENMTLSPVKEGKIEVIAACDGLFTVDVEKLDAVNECGEIIVATRHTNYPVKKGDKLAATRVIPLVIEKEKVERAVSLAGGPILHLTPYRPFQAGVVTTGNEVFYGRIKDTFTPVIEEKLAQYGISIAMHECSDDNPDHIAERINIMLGEGMDMVICTGGMSVDPDDTTPGAIRRSGAEIVSYGAPVLPGAMFLLAYHQGRPVMGLPGCVMYAASTIFDLALPRIAAGIPITKKDLARLGHGGLCLGCRECRYPDCGFGKGV